MAAHSKAFPWMSHSGGYSFFERRMGEHDKVRSITKVNPSVYNMQLVTGRNIKVFVCDCYSFDVAEYIESCDQFGSLDAIVISSNWCGYSLGVKRHCMSEKVGIFDIAGFMAAINKSELWTYLTKYEKECFQKNGWL